MSDAVKPKPDGYHSVTPYLVISGAAEAIDFYTEALAAVERFRMPGPDGKLMHAEIQIGDSVVMLSDENLEMGASSPATLGGTPVGQLIYVEDVDAAFQHAVSAGATGLLPPTDMFWGDRYCKLQDPFGHQWSLATHVEDVSAEEMNERATAAFAEQPAG